MGVAPTLLVALQPIDGLETIPMNRLRLLASSISLLGLLAVAACAGQVADDQGDGTLSDDQELKAEGKMCGGIAGLRCKAGLNCKLKGNFPDASGTCVAPKPGEAGALCGGIAGLQCKSGLVCKFASSSSGPPPGAVGMPAPSGTGTSHGPPPGAVGLPFPDQSGSCVVSSSGPPPGAVGMPKPNP